MNTVIKREILEYLDDRFVNLLLVEDPTDIIVLGTPITNGPYAVLFIETGSSGKTMTWGVVTQPSGEPANRFIQTSNSATSSPLNYSVPEGKVPNKLVLVETGSNLVRGLITLSGVPSYAAGDGAFYVRNIRLKV